MFKKSQTKKIVIKLLVLLIYTSPSPLSAQCAMCRASLQGQQNIVKAEAVNDGIVYLMIIPYLLIGILGFIIYKMYKKNN